jgi:hypothetical protein
VIDLKSAHLQLISASSKYIKDVGIICNHPTDRRWRRCDRWRDCGCGLRLGGCCRRRFLARDFPVRQIYRNARAEAAVTIAARRRARPSSVATPAPAQRGYAPLCRLRPPASPAG